MTLQDELCWFCDLIEAKTEFKYRDYYFCSEECLNEFVKDASVVELDK